MRGYRKSEPHIHSTAVTLHRRIKESFDFGKRHDLVELRPYFNAAHSKDSAVQKDILAPSQFRVKAGPDFKQTSHSTLDADPAFAWVRNSAQNLQKSRFTGAI